MAVSTLIRRALAWALMLTALCACVVQAEETPHGLRGFVRGGGYHYVAYGDFPQSAEGEVAPLVWRVLEVAEGQAYLLSEYVLEAHQVHHAWESYGDWLETDLYAYLNGDFLRAAFSEAEQRALVQRVAPGTVFLPSQSDIANAAYGFSGDASRQGVATDYGVTSGLFVYRGGRQYSPYWTRTRDTKRQPGSTRRTMGGGALGYIRAIVADLGYRPGVLLTLDAVDCVGGAGTLADPFRLVPGGAEGGTP